ncbi:MAG TPA: lysophospholipid acyltransferase family protein [Pyrinomonadaceae bacterium]|nr:lysophospholipid acyltransferase family protein [Pyrinomonadaceae bacterium]
MTSETKYPPYFVYRLLTGVAWTISKVLWLVRFEGVENIPRAETGGLLIAANHQTYVDPVWISIPLRRKMQYLSYDKAFEWRFIGSFMRFIGAFPVKHPIDTSTSFMKKALRSLRDGAGLIIFPEGAREFADGKMFEFKNGIVHIAERSGVPILPVTIIGGNRIWPQLQKYPGLFRRVTIRFHPPIAIEKGEDVDEATERLRQTIASGLPNS